MWGTLTFQPLTGLLHRITPTCVGNTMVGHWLAVEAQDHPHLCGEHFFSAFFPVVKAGSPPPVWGTPMQKAKPRKIIRITPTCVGNTC